MKLYYEPENNENQKTISAPEHTLQGDNIHEETKNQHLKMKDKPFKEKAMYYFGYYKYHALGVIVGIGILISIVHAVASSKDYCFNAMIFNSSNINGEFLADNFSEYADFDLNEYDCSIDANLVDGKNASGFNDASAGTKFTAMMATKDLDIAVYDSFNFYIKALNSVYINLNEVLTDEQIKKYEPYFYYIDMEEVKAAEEDDAVIVNAGLLESDEKALEADIKKHMDPSNMKEPIAVGIVISDSNLITATDAYPSGYPVLGIIVNSQRIPAATKFIDYIFDNNIDFYSVAVTNIS